MTHNEARSLAKGDYLISAYTSPAWRSLRITDVGPSIGSKFVYVRLHKLAGQSQMAGGWCDATLFIKAPSGYKYDEHKAKWYKKVQRTNSEPTFVWWEPPSVAEFRAQCPLLADDDVTPLANG